MGLIFIPNKKLNNIFLYMDNIINILSQEPADALYNCMSISIFILLIYTTQLLSFRILCFRIPKRQQPQWYGFRCGFRYAPANVLYRHHCLHIPDQYMPGQIFINFL